jgi:hypothetical protein
MICWNEMGLTGMGLGTWILGLGIRFQFYELLYEGFFDFKTEDSGSGKICLGSIERILIFFFS